MEFDRNFRKPLSGALSYLFYAIRLYIMDITVEELKEKIERGDQFVLIDVREPHEHEEFNVGGELIPVGRIPIALPGLEARKEEEIVVYCRSGSRSGVAKVLMERKGFKNVRNLTGGMMAWVGRFGIG